MMWLMIDVDELRSLPSLTFIREIGSSQSVQTVVCKISQVVVKSVHCAVDLSTSGVNGSDVFNPCP